MNKEVSPLTQKIVNRKLNYDINGRFPMTVNLDVSLIDILDKIALQRLQRIDDLIDGIIKTFEMNGSDCMYIMKGPEELTFAQSLLNTLFNKHSPKREYVSYRVSLDTYKRIEELKERSAFYARSPVVKYILEKYLKKNFYL